MDQIITKMISLSPFLNPFHDESSVWYSQSKANLA